MPSLSRRTILLIPAAATAQNTSTESAIRGVLEMQQAAWNRGDVEAFMSGYESSEDTTFVGAGRSGLITLQ